jgi:NTE family protein
MKPTNEPGDENLAPRATKKMMAPSTVDLVLEGGGAKGIGHVGVIRELEERGCRWERIAGVSAGAIVGALLANGYTGAELERTLRDLQVVTSDPRPLARIPVVGPVASVLLQRSLYRAENFRAWLDDHLRTPPGGAGAKQGRPLTFGDLRYVDAERPSQPAWKLVVVATDLTLGQLVYLPWDYERLYGVDPDRQRVAGVAEFVDGGLLANYPIEIFDRRDGVPPRWPTLGVKILPRLPWPPGGLKLLMPDLHLGSLKFGQRVVVSAIFGRDQARLGLPWIKARTIEVDTSSVGMLGFRPKPAEVEQAFLGGRRAVSDFVDQWDWDEYLAVYRGS